MSRKRRIAIGAAMLIAYLLQLSIFPELRIFGVQPDLMLVLAIVVAIQDGPVEGLVVGFIGGLACDLTGNQILGVGAFSRAVTAFFAGYIKDFFITYSVILPFFLAFFGGLAEKLLYQGGLAVLGSEPLPPLLLKHIFPAAFYDSILIFVLFPILRRFSEELGKEKELSIKA